MKSTYVLFFLVVLLQQSVYWYPWTFLAICDMIVENSEGFIGLKTIETIGNNTRIVSDGDLKYIQFECFDKYEGHMIHCMSTRLGGVSQGDCSSLNLGFNRKDDRRNVKTNFHIICESIGVDCESLVFSNQVHDDKVKIVNEKDKGKGFSKVGDIIGYDGLVTNTPGVTLVTFYADCVPILLYEQSKNVAALVHSGWRSTLKGIGAKAVSIMVDEFLCPPEGIVSAIGPSICKCCFEVDNDVYMQFLERYGNQLFYQNIGKGKWKIDLQGIIENTLLGCGLLKDNIFQSNICTRCRKDIFFSHRGDSGRTGSLAAFMQLL